MNFGKKSSHTRAFTLIELLVVISIVSLMSSVALSALNSAREKARIARGLQFSSQADRVAGEQAVGIWDFEENAGTLVSDRSGFGNNGAFSSAGWTTNTPTNRGSAGSFNGARYVLIPYSALLQPADTITVSAWFNPDITTGSQRILSNTETGGYSLTFNENSVCPTNTYCAALYRGSYRVASVPISRVKEDVWQHALMSFDGTTLRLYLDGVEVSSTAVPAGTIGYSFANPLCIGGEATAVGCSSAFTGSIDNVRVFTKALTASDVSKLYALELEKFRVAKK